MKIAIIGTGHVGLVTGACFAQKGHKVICVDNNHGKIKSLQKLIMPFYEPRLEQMVRRNYKASRLIFSTDIKQAVNFAEIVFIAVGTPLGPGGGADLSQIRRVAKEIAHHLNHRYKIIVEKSTVPVGTAEEIERIIKLYAPENASFDIVSNPEFLQEGSAIETTLRPDRIVLGVKTKRADNIIRLLFASFNSKILVTDINSAELIKHAANSFLAMKISYINSLANICEKTGADIKSVAYGIGLDKRINPHFLNAGIGYGGFCLPKDISAFIHISDKLGYDFQILKAVRDVNNLQREFVVRKIKKSLRNNLKNRHIGIWGLSFKPDTDDIRESPSIYIIQKLLQEQAYIKSYDPYAMKEAQKVLPNIHYCRDPYETAYKTDCLFIATEWDIFKNISLPRLKAIMRQPIIIDGRNIFEPEKMKKLGFVYHGIGREEPQISQIK
ncbi:MAG: UDP-glucose/GDP-mannose dehydrogenase family protein [Planctomycetota bacterium]|nr:UDP-glucose/GDP-mannose dehydrogenase family protein [Planctomycetota bacterium]MDI6786872.1 UDP-glucose/GDP-mannose dehydrogenase family protein [Planctomycetota bacterium]